MPKQKDTTHTLIERELILYRRERSEIWQCRYKVDEQWLRGTTKERDLAKAKKKAYEIRMEAEIRKRENIPVITRKFRDVAKLAIERLNNETDKGKGKVSYDDYKRVIQEYLIPILGKRNITSIDYEALDDLDKKRAVVMQKTPSQSTMLTHNAALNRVFDEAIIRGFLTEANRPKLEATGKKSTRRAGFDVHEVRALRANFDGWIGEAKTDKSKELRALLRDYVEVLLDTGARPGKELMNLQWRQIKFEMTPEFIDTGKYEQNESDGIDKPEPLLELKANRALEFVVSGKTGTRTIVAMTPTVQALERIAKRNYDTVDKFSDPFKTLTKPSNKDYIFRTRLKEEPTSFQKMFESYLRQHNLLEDPVTGQERVFYSLRHTYATMMLTHDGVPIHTLAKQMGTSVLMIEKHYSHLKVVQAKKQLRGEETRKLLEAGGEIDEAYKSNKKPKNKN
jgi:integrase